MGEILGIGMSDFPMHRFTPDNEAAVIKGNRARGAWQDKPELNDPTTWPPEMQKLWGDDESLTSGTALQNSQIEQFRKIRTVLDEFKPDAIALMFRDIGEAWGPVTEPENKRPKYWLHLHEDKTLRPFSMGAGRVGLYGETAETTVPAKIHREATEYLIEALRKEAPVAPEVCTEPKAPMGMGHNFVAGTIHTDWDKREYATPFIGIGLNPFGFDRSRNNEGLSEWDKTKTPPLTPQESFEIGRVLARAIKASPWKIALVADVDWSNAQDTWRGYHRISPDVEADRVIFEQWKAGNFTNWGDSFTFEDMETHSRWELLVTIMLAGAMTEVGAKINYTHFQEGTLIFNDDMVTTIFEAK